MRKKYLVVYGLGGCWSGYKNAQVVEATDDTIKSVTFKIANDYWYSQETDAGLSYDWEEITGDVNDCDLYQSRLHPTGRAMVNRLPFAVHSMGKTFLARQIMGLRTTNDFLQDNREYGVIHADYARDLYLVAENESQGVSDAELASQKVAGHVTL